MRRRELIGALGGAATASLLWPLAARAQSVMPVIGFLHAGSAEENVKRLAAFRKGLAAGGFVEGQNVAIEFQFAENQYARLPSPIPNSRQPCRTAA